MTAAATTGALSRGATLFARYAHAPNALGFCGPSGAALRDGSEAQVRAAARRFSGAWPYLQVLAALTGTDDPLDEDLVRGYWLGTGAPIDRQAFGAELLRVLGPQAGHYWAHLTPALLAEAAGNHCFHVFGVYPWSRLLGQGMDEHPLGVLDNCRIRWGTVVGTDPAADVLHVETRRLTFDGQVLAVAPPAVEQVAVAGARDVEAEVGDTVAVHWNQLCDRLTATEVEALAATTRWQLDVTNTRLGGASR